MNAMTMPAEIRTMAVRATALAPIGAATVGAGFARGLLELAASKGADRRLLAQRAGIALSALEDQDARLPFSAYIALMREGQALAGDPALGLHYGERVDIADVSIVGLMGQASVNMMEAFQQLNRYVRLIVDVETAEGGDRFRLQMKDGGLWLVDARCNPNGFPELTESAFAQLICGPRRFGPGPKLKAAHFTHSDPGYAAEYERIFGCPVTFGAAWNAVQLEPTWAPQAVARLPRYVFGVLAEKADALLKELESAQTARGRVEAALMPSLHTGAAGMDEIASKLAMSRQTLFRRLKAEGVTFEKVLDELRCRMALDYLAARKVSVNETAYLVGFSDPAAFSRAFKRWTGRSPSDLRGQKLAA